MIGYNPVIQSIIMNGSQKVDVLRLDLIHPEVNGNKWFKLKYNLESASRLGLNTILTFGGASSNHIAATASACRIYGFRSIGMIRGQDQKDSETLKKAKADGMELNFLSRQTYAEKHLSDFHEQLHRKFGKFWLIPEGGSNAEGVKGCAEILTAEMDHDFIFCAVGTAATFAGLLASAGEHQRVIGISVLKGDNHLPERAEELLRRHLPDNGRRISDSTGQNKYPTDRDCITADYAFSGYAGFDQELINFKAKFGSATGIPLDYIYTVKLFYAVGELISRGLISNNSRPLVIHSGGLQGNAEFERRYRARLSL